ncbi:MAG: DUF4381 domain-containing protein [Pseudomonadales bacterium]|jgi:hypothetical protein|nr:DUF4381 domain-containing protein [Pseudomonadales bacterium]MDP4765026.1 DUF4381 domain-containing protein [Pseudomonadales bacterium]MDP4874414.1 DUF4381 domain-containing protein [Pseudomonadales bacterium]MDP4910286.1 DUF4381 domain-containing protein [Pseudomonadales bacterium]MDP5058085.1 DUF4381 domain-containing protein [Pseudomonadales bacterium]
MLEQLLYQAETPVAELTPQPPLAQSSPPAADPLAGLRDIRLPEALHTLPAPGWWLLGLLALALLGYGAYRLWRYWRGNAYRREALQELTRLQVNWQVDNNSLEYLRLFTLLLKRVALTHYPRQTVAALTGDAWVTFLDKTLGSHEFTMGAGQVLIQGHYQPQADIDVAALHTLGQRWIKAHHGLPVTLPGRAQTAAEPSP